MKKSFALGLVGMLTLSLLTGCGAEQVKSQYLMENVNYKKYVKLCKYTGVDAEQVEFSVTDEEVEETLEEEMYEYAEYPEVTGRNIEQGDFVSISYTGIIDGAESEDYSGEDEIQVGTEFFYPAAEEAMVGKKAKDSFETKITLDEDWAYNEEDAGKELLLKVTINSCTEEILPELTDDFVQEHTEYNSVDEYKAALREEVQKSKEEEYKADTVNEVLDYIVEHSKFNDYPQELYDSCKEAFDSQNEYEAMMNGMDADTYLEMLGMSDEEIKKAVEESVKYELAVGMIAIEQQMDCTKEEVSSFIEDNYVDYGYSSAEELLEDYSEQEIGYILLYQKVMDYLYDNANKKPISEEDYNARNAEMFGIEDDEVEIEE